MLSAIAWLGNILIIVGLYKIGNKQRSAFIWSICGESVWTTSALLTGNWALAFICTVFNLMAVRSYIKWGKDDTV